ncbi:uncharacterized protein FFMR_13828 [Fusarium fujikuroi]|nr:uncharacterized protein FFC1_12922 [Fusarium fujikuroi]SCO25566.1 uncharacterized protein FFM5_14167 [Fusarium fujikuroi]SCO56672.1 uncharacterized protein FFMR_13828 [Fusarium fujikuroi]
MRTMRPQGEPLVNTLHIMNIRITFLINLFVRTTAPSPAVATGDEISPVPPKKPRLKHTVENTIGSDLCLPLIVNDEAPELPRALRYVFWMGIPESTENSDNEMFGNSEEVPERQERLYSSWEETSDSDEDSESDALA